MASSFLSDKPNECFKKRFSCDGGSVWCFAHYTLRFLYDWRHIMPDPAKIDVHYTPEGSRLIAGEVVRVIDRQRKAAQ